MRLAVLADIHGNLPAFEAVLAHARSLGVDRFVVTLSSTSAKSTVIKTSSALCARRGLKLPPRSPTLAEVRGTMAHPVRQRPADRRE